MRITLSPLPLALARSDSPRPSLLSPPPPTHTHTHTKLLHSGVCLGFGGALPFCFVTSTHLSKEQQQQQQQIPTPTLTWRGLLAAFDHMSQLHSLPPPPLPPPASAPCRHARPRPVPPLLKTRLLAALHGAHRLCLCTATMQRVLTHRFFVPRCESVRVCDGGSDEEGK